MRYHPHTPEDIRVMLEAIGAKSVDELLRSIPERLRAKKPLDVPPAVDEIGLFAEMTLATVSVPALVTPQVIATSSPSTAVLGQMLLARR